MWKFDFWSGFREPDTNCVQKITIRKPDSPVFEWSLYMYSICLGPCFQLQLTA
jgi:hypothetical protein